MLNAAGPCKHGAVRRRTFAVLAAAVAAISGVIAPPARWSAAAPTGTALRAISPNATQLIVGVADDWSSNRVILTRFERKPGGTWAQIGPGIAARLGINGLAWGRGLIEFGGVSNVADSTGPEKVEGDGRAPAGIFRLETVYAYEVAWGRRTTMPFVAVGANDLFVEDPTSDSYNTHIRLDHAPATAWEKKQQMEQGDAAHRLKVFVGHNSHPPTPGRGSAIFLHVWRKQGAVPTTGCTAMSFENLSTVVRWLRPSANPAYVLLPKLVYQSVRSAMDLPTIER